MAIDTEAIWADLFARLENSIAGVKTYARKRRDYGIEEMPALLVLDDAGDEFAVDPNARAGDGLPPAWKLTGEIVVLARTEDSDAKPTAALNTLVKAVRERLERQPTDPLGTGAFYGRSHVQFYTNLGGKLLSFQILKVEKGSGTITGQAAATIEIEMVAL